MADTVQLRVELQNYNEVINQLNNIDAWAAKYNGKPIKLQFGGTNLRNYAQKMNEVAAAVGKVTSNGQAASQAMQALEKNTSSAAKNVDKTFKNANKSLSQTHDLMWQIQNRVKYIAANAVLSTVTKNFREALNTMREVDAELVNIQKVTDRTDSQIAKLGKTAYSTASQYGVAANEYLQSVGTFAKAGYGDIADQLGELAIKTQLVGDVSADVASQFLLSVDAAYKYGGSIEKLNGVLDKANAVENNFATSIEKIADGMPIVASVAATANMSIEETIAALGTITATTQESGTKAATALRALILNIIGDTTTELEDGVKWTYEEINSLNDVLWRYSKEAMNAAKATGGIVDPMEAIAGLSKAFKEGVLTEADLMELVSKLGGKLRTNQLIALVENFDMFQAQLQTMGASAGSADREVSTMLNSWDSKVNILKNTWTETVSSFVETDAIKGAIDTLTTIVAGLNNEAVQTVVTIGAIAAGGAGLVKVITAIGAALSGSPIFLAAAILGGIVAVVDSLTTSFEEASEAAEQLRNEYDALWGEGGTYQQEYDALIVKGNAMTDVERTRLEVLKAQREELHSQVQEAQATEYAKWSEMYGSGAWEIYGVQGANGLFDEKSVTVDEYNVLVARDAINALSDAYARGQTNLSEYYEGLQNIISSESEQVEQLRAYQEAGVEITAFERDRIRLYDELTARMGPLSEAVAVEQAKEQELAEQKARLEEAAKATGRELDLTNDSVKDLAESEAKLDDKVETEFETPGLDLALARVERYAGFVNGLDGRTVATSFSSGLVTGVGRRATGTTSAPGGPTLVNELGPELISSNGYAWIAGGGAPTVTNLPKGATVLTAAQTRRAVNGLNGVIPAAKAGFTGSSHGAFGFAGNTAYMVSDSPSDSSDRFALIAPRKGGKKASGGGGYGSGTWAAAPNFKSLESALSDALKNLDLQAELAENQGDYAKMIAMYSAAEDKIAELVQKYRDAGYAEDSSEILTLLNKGYDYAGKRKSLSSDLWNDLVDSIEGITESTDKANTLAEKELAVADAQRSLDNARNQRTVRVFNPVTGQWEWVANAADVANAQKSLQSAQEALQKEQLSRELEALKSGDMSAVLGPAISAILGSADEEQLRGFAAALRAVSGTADFTPNAGTQSTLYGNSSDSHDTVYYFPGGITLTDDQAQNITLAELAKQLRILNLT